MQAQASPLLGELRQALAGAVARHWAPAVFLSGGVDSSILALLAHRIRPVTAITFCEKRAEGDDLPHARRVARHLGVPLVPFAFDEREYFGAVPIVVEILRSYDRWRVKIGCALYLALRRARELGFDAVMTGDGADEVFGAQGREEARRSRSVGDFRRRLFGPSGSIADPLGRALGMRTTMPYLDAAVLSFGRASHVEEVGAGEPDKWLLKAAFAGELPSGVLRRKKTPLMKGCGVYRIFLSRHRGRRRDLAESIRLPDDETAYYYDVFRKRFGAPAPVSLEKGRLYHVCNGRRGVVRSRFCSDCGSPVLF